MKYFEDVISIFKYFILAIILIESVFNIYLINISDTQNLLLVLFGVLHY